MRITEGQLRRIVREELTRNLDEMAYGATLTGPGGVDIRLEPGHATFGPDVERAADPEVASRLFKSAKFQADAARLYANIPYKVWLAPIFGPTTDAQVPNPDDETDRMAYRGLSMGGVERLKDFGFMLPDEIDTRNDLVIAVISPLAGRLNAQDGKISVSSTPWTIFHAIFDSTIGYKRDAIDYLAPGYQEFLGDLAQRFGEPRPLKRLVGALTMGAARKNELRSVWDAGAEMMVQELIDKRGLRLDLSGLQQEEAEQLLAFGNRVKGLAAEFRENARGKLIVVRG